MEDHLRYGKRNNNMKGFVVLSLLVLMIFLSGCARSEPKNVSTRFVGVSVTESGSQTCKNIVDATARDSCYSSVAFNTLNKEVCKKIERSDKKDICYSGVALNTRNALICEQISDESVKENCINQIN
jgi:hypothetical protein